MTALYKHYPFKQYRPIKGFEIQLVLAYCLEGVQAMDQMHAYVFNICLKDGRVIGQIDFRVGESDYLRRYGGQIGYGIDEHFRGHQYAKKACELIKKVALDHAMQRLWITCNTENVASIKTCQALGAKLVDKVDVPKGCELYHRGDREKFRFLWIL